MAESDPSSEGSPRAERSGSAHRGALRSALTEAAPAVRRYLFGMCGRWDEAEDLSQEALLKAWAASCRSHLARPGAFGCIAQREGGPPLSALRWAA